MVHSSSLYISSLLNGQFPLYTECFSPKSTSSVRHPPQTVRTMIPEPLIEAWDSTLPVHFFLDCPDSGKLREHALFGVIHHYTLSMLQQAAAQSPSVTVPDGAALFVRKRPVWKRIYPVLPTRADILSATRDTRREYISDAFPHRWGAFRMKSAIRSQAAAYSSRVPVSVQGRTSHSAFSASMQHLPKPPAIRPHGTCRTDDPPATGRTIRPPAAYTLLTTRLFSASPLFRCPPDAGNIFRHPRAAGFLFPASSTGMGKRWSPGYGNRPVVFCNIQSQVLF